MSIHFISGKPGGGKTMYAVKLIVDELVYGTRQVVTNVALKLPELNGYLQREYPSKSVNLFERVRRLDEEETGHFWCFRPGCTLRVLAKAEWKNGLKPDYSGVRDNGVFFVIDEIHNFFGSRQWMDTGQDCLFYLSQHRKLGDTVVCVTQAVLNVDGQFRRVAQDFSYVKNLSKQKEGWFRLPAVFLRRTYGAPLGPGGEGESLEGGSFRLDVRGIAACYDSAAGVGILGGRVADMGERKRGLDWRLGIVMVVGLCLFLFFGLPQLIASAFRTPADTIVQRTTQAASVVVDSPVPAVKASPVGSVGKASREEVLSSVSSTNGLLGVGWARGRPVYFFSDGHNLRLGDPDLVVLNGRTVVRAGVTNTLR